MTRSRSTLLLETRREPTLDSKSIVDNRVLFNDDQKSVRVSYTVDWFDPFVLSKSNAFHITVNCKLPEMYQKTINQKSANHVRVMLNLQHEYIVLLTNTHFYFYQKKSNVYATQPIANAQRNGPDRAATTIPLCDVLLVQGNNTVHIITVDDGGQARLFAHNGKELTQKTYKVPLYRQDEYTTAVKWINADQVLIGSSTGQVYLLNLTSKTALTLYKERIATVLDFMVVACYRQLTPQASDHTLPRPQDTGPIVNISVVKNNLCFVCSHQNVSLWRIKTETQAELIAHIRLRNDIIDCILPHVPPHVTKYALQCKIVDMDIKIKEKLVLLVSYAVPELSDFLQYAVIEFHVDYSNDTAVMYAKHTASLPYSALSASLSKPPRLNVTNDIAFVSFSDTVVARSLSKHSVFEESLVLKDKDDAILSVTIVETDDSLATAMVVTAKNDILEFQVNKDDILESRKTGNIYASLVDNISERDTMVFKSRLEQALFFGVYNESPLRFPLVVEHDEDVGSAFLDVTNDILTEKCRFLPKSLDSEIPFIETRFYFQNHLYKILQDHMLDHLLSDEQKSRSFELLELYYVSRQLWKIIQEKLNDSEWIDSAALISQTVVKTELGGKLQLEHLLRDHIYKIQDFLAEIAAHQESTCADVILPRIIQKCRSFEEKNKPRYGLHTETENSFFVQTCEYLVGMFEQKVQQQQQQHRLSGAPCPNQEAQTLQDTASLLLDVYSKQSNVEKYDAVKKTVVEGLCVAGLYHAVVDLADKYGDISHIVSSVPKLKLSPEEFKENSHTYIERFGYPYFEHLLNQMDDDDDHHVWYFCGCYPEFADAFFLKQDHLPKIAWKYHVKKQDYKKALQAMWKCRQEDPLYDAWLKILSALDEE